MSSIDVGGYINTDVENPKGGYWEPFIITQGIVDHWIGHYVRPNRVAF
jgi:hypothetical protein